MTNSYWYGAFNLNNQPQTVLLDKPLDFPTIKEALFKIAKTEGMKKTGEDVSAKQIQVRVQLIASSRSALEALIDTLLQSLALRQQQLVLHADGRYWIADCIDAKIPLGPQNTVSTVVTLTFLAQNPYAYAALSTSDDTGSGAMTFLSGTTYQLNRIITGGGNIYAYPHLQLRYQTPGPFCTLTGALNNGSTYGVIPVSATPIATANGSMIVIGFGTGTMQIACVDAGGVAQGSTSLPIGSPTNGSFVAAANFPIGTPVYFCNTLGASLANGTNYTSITLTAPGLPCAVANGDTLIINFLGGSSQSVTVNHVGGYAAGTTVIAVASFNANANYSSGIFSGVTVVRDIRPTAFSLSEVTDSRTITLSGATSLPQNYGDIIDIYCDPFDSTNGLTVQKNNVPVAFSGAFPVLQPFSTTFLLQLSCPSVPTVELITTWTPRWVS